MVCIPKNGNQKKKTAEVYVKSLHIFRIIYKPNAKFCKFVIFAAIDSLTNATDTILILYVDPKKAQVLLLYNFTKGTRAEGEIFRL